MPDAPRSFQAALNDTGRFVFLYGTTPPSAGATPERVERAASRLAARATGRRQRAT